MLSRRQLLAMTPSGLLLPRALFGAAPSTDHKFFFIYCFGGWDPTMCFTPMFDSPNIDTEDDAATAEANGISFVDHEDRPSVKAFFEAYGDRACVINGMEVRSVTHERCQRIAFTGGTEAAADDWGVTMASNTVDYYAVPHLVLSGPAFSAKYAANVVRAGETGQLVELMDGSALEKSTLAITTPGTYSAAYEDAYLLERIRAFGGRSPAGTPSRMGELYEQALENIALLSGMGDSVDLNPNQSGCRRDLAADAAVAFNAFQVGLSRCAITKDMGWCSTSWDTHANNIEMQTRNFEELFGYLNDLMADLDTRTGSTGSPLRDEVTVVVFSEMGRHPQLTAGGRAHWTFTSAMIVGAGVKGGQVIGKMNDNYEGESIDLDSGAVDSNGQGILPGHLGATLLEIAGLDYTQFVSAGEPIRAAMDI